MRPLPAVLLLLLLSLVSLPSTLGQTPTPTWSHLFRIDCDGTFEIAPSIGVGVKLPIIRNVINEVLKTFLGRAQCLCPNATRADFDLLFDPVTAMLNNFRATPNPYNQCLRENLPRNFDQMTMFRIDLPNTCSSESWATNGTCGIKHNFPRVKAELQVGISKCPNSFFPSISLTCAGEGCSTLGRPCASNADCQGLTCFDAESTMNLASDDTIPDAIFKAFQKGKIYDEDDTSPGCYQAKRGNSTKTPENDVITYALSFVAKNFFAANSDYNKIKFCGILEVVNFTAPEESFTLNDTALAGTGIHLSSIPSSTSSCLLPDTSHFQEVQDYFSFASQSDNVINWLDGIRLLDYPCPDFSKRSFCPPQPGNSNGGSNGNGCDDYIVRSAYFHTHDTFYDTNCFPSCDMDFSGVFVGSQDIKSFLDATVSFATFYGESSYFDTVLTRWTVGPFGRLLGMIQNSGQMTGTQEKIDFTKRLAAFLKIYDLVVVDDEDLASQESRSSANNHFTFLLGQLSDITRRLSDFSICADSRSVQELQNLLSSEAAGYYTSFDQDHDGLLSPTEGEQLSQLQDIPFSGTYQQYYAVFYSQDNSSITDLSMSMSEFFQIISELSDLNQDGYVTGQELLQAQASLQSYGYSLDFTSESVWSFEVTKSSMLQNLSAQVNEIFDLNSIDEIFTNGGVLNMDGYDSLPISFFSLLTSQTFNMIPLSVVNTNLYEEVMSTLQGYDQNQDQKLSFSEAQGFFSATQGKGTFIDSVSRSILSTLFTSIPNGEMTWQEFSSSNLDEVDKLNKTTRLHIVVPGLKPWDGIESGGTSAFTRPSVIPTFSKIPDRTVLAQFTCDQNLIFETHNAGLLLSQRLQKVFPQATSLLKDLIACRSNPADNDMARFLVRYGVWAPLLWLHVIDESSANYPLPEDQVDWVRTFFEEDMAKNVRVRGLPSSCNFYHFLETGSCELDFLGLKTLLLADITIRISLKSCGPSNAFSSYTIECLGEDCGFLSGLNPCDTDSQCSSGLFCTPLPRITAYLSNKLDSPKDSSYFENLRFNETLLTDFILKTDFFGLFFSKEFNGNLCSSPSFFDENSGPNIMDYFGNYPQGLCFGPNQWSADVQRILVNVFGSENPNSGIQSKLQFCTPELSVFDPEVIQRWANTLVIVDGPTVTLNPNIFKAVSAPVPTSPPSGLPTCRCSTSCGSLASACSKCYQAGGMVVPTAPSICFCPSNGQSLPTALLNNWDVTMDPLCASPLPECANCTSCAVSCATCFGTASSQCLSCTNPNHLFITKYDSNGALISGRCLPPCQEGQYRNSDGICVDPDCSGLDSCSGNGICFHSEFTQDDRCRCNDGFYGNDCSKMPSCAAFDDCNGQGSCVYNQHFRAGRCQCYPGYTLEDCSHAIVKFTPNFDTELGGSEIVVVHPDGFGPNDEVECQFGSTVVAGKPNNDGSASCIAPPSAEVRVAIQTAVRKNGGDWSSTEEPFFYYFSEKLVPRSEAQLRKLEWRNGTLQQITWSSNDACMYPTVNIYLIPWEVSQEAGTVTLGQKVLLAEDIDTDDGAVNVTAKIPFSLTKPLYVLSIEGPRCSINRYVIPVDGTPNYGSMCQSWVTAETAASKNWTSGLPGCAPNRWIRDPGFEAYPHCSAQNAAANPVSNCYTNLGAIECRFSTRPLSPNFGGQTCCYSQGGDLLTNRATGGGNGIRYGVGSNGAIRVVASFVGDLLPGLLCCRLSDKCNLFSGVRPTSTENAWIPPRTGGASGDPHLVTLDGKFWTFNGLGEYVLLERTDNATSDFVLQARFARAPSMNVNAANATVLKGFAVRDAAKVVSGYLGELEGLILFVDGQEVPALSPGSSFLSPNGGVVLFAQADKYVISLPSGASLEVSAAVSMISLVTLLPASFKGKTRGLMGTWDQNKNNDFLLRNGTTLPFDATQETLFHGFGEPYRVTAQSSLFTYPDDEGFADYNDLGFIPAFITPNFPTEEARNIAMAACAQAPSVDACLYDVAQTGDIRVANVALKSGAVFQTFASAANTPPSFTNPPAKVNVRLGQNVTVQFAVADAEHQEVSLNALTSPEGGSLQGLTFSFKVVNGMYIARSVVPLKVVAVDEGGSVSDPAITNFTVVFSTCADGKDPVELEASLDLAAYCLSSGCSDECAASISRIIALEDTCRKEVISDLGETFTKAREKCCATVQTISCADKATGGLSTGAIIGIAVGASVGGLALIGLLVLFVIKAMKGKGKDEENEMKETKKK